MLRASKTAKRMLQTACPKSFQSFKSQVDTQVFHSFPEFPVLQSAISSLPIWYQLLAVCFDLLTCLLDPTGDPVTTPGVYHLNPGSPGVPLKNHHISSLSAGPVKIRKSAPRVTKRHKNVSQIPPSGHQINE